MLGRIRWYDDGRIEAGFIPVYVEPPGRPVIAAGAKAREIIDYVTQITVAAGLEPLSLNIQKHMVVAS